MTLSPPMIPPLARLGIAAAALALLAGCDKPLDFDLRGKLGVFDTSGAAQAVGTSARPQPDARGIISYPGYQVAVARRGDSVADVAGRIGLPAADLARFNGLKPESTLHAGEVLALPRRVAEPALAAGEVDIASLATSAIDSAPDTTPGVEATPLAPAAAPPAAGPEPVRHQVARGETAYTISRLYQVPVKALAEWNGLGSDFTIREGQYLLIPVRNQPPPRSAAAPVSAPGQGSPTPTPPSASAPLPDEKVDPKPPEKPRVSVGEPSRPGTARMAMPVGGKIVRSYAKGRNDGIDIAGSPGTVVVAAADGTVRAVTADADRIPIIVVDHGDNLLSVYANLDRIAVARGDTVKRGQKLAQLRDGDNAYVHFEVRKGFDSVDPMPYLK